MLHSREWFPPWEEPVMETEVKDNDGKKEHRLYFGETPPTTLDICQWVWKMPKDWRVQIRNAGKKGRFLSVKEP